MEPSLRANQSSILSEIERMPEAPRQRISHHRRARSDTFFSGESIDDLLLFDPSDVDFSSLDFLNSPTPPPQQPQQPSPMSVDSPSEETSSNGAPPPIPLPPGRHVRSFSVDSESDFLDDLTTATEDNHPFAGKLATGEKRGHHRSNSMDGATSSGSFNIESVLAAMSFKDGGAKKNMGMGSDRLAELALLDPKRAKR
ncbi:unnamed protein product [Thlaspi arvense]|uniref:Uncharacterized protein n=1 Tax=Thlaspi arvense TaxID=13288 RepID=A0AAU9R7K4_THLAR|nr:unnamed protein product [Thlaspi arvense]